MLIKLRAVGKKEEMKRMATSSAAHHRMSPERTYTIELTGDSGKLDAFIQAVDRASETAVIGGSGVDVAKSPAGLNDSLRIRTGVLMKVFDKDADLAAGQGQEGDDRRLRLAGPRVQRNRFRREGDDRVAQGGVSGKG
jgi:hypothetical protein